MNNVPRPPAPGTMDTAADKHGQTVPQPENKKRLLELQAELEKASGKRRESIQEEIDRLGEGTKK